jgi:multidrug transporter EmrE-like cation transporter
LLGSAALIQPPFRPTFKSVFLQSLRYYSLLGFFGGHMIYFLILLGVMLNAAAQLLLKAGMNQIGHFEFNAGNVLPIGIKVMGNLPIVAGLTAYVVSVGVWLLVLSRVQVSYAYPMLSIGYVVNALAAYYFFGEDLSLVRITGILVIIGGVYLIAQSPAV